MLVTNRLFTLLVHSTFDPPNPVLLVCLHFYFKLCPGVVGLWCDLGSNSRPHDHVLLPGGQRAAALPRAVQQALTRAVPHVGTVGNTGMVAGVAARVHEGAGPGQLWKVSNSRGRLLTIYFLVIYL